MGAWGKIKELSKVLTGALYPRQCISCSSQLEEVETHALCLQCWGKLPIICTPTCPGCGMPFDSIYAHKWSPSHLCQECRQTAYRFDSASSVGRYEGALRELILSFKLRGNFTAGKDCAFLIKEHSRRLIEGKELHVVANVPLHWQRLMSREFDQASLLAQAAVEALGIPFEKNTLLRVAPTRRQTDVKPNERWKNVRGAFEVKDPRVFENKSVLLVDDVFTTGATVNECAGALKRGGASAVHVLTLARASG